MPEMMIVIASLPRCFTTTGRPLLVGAAAAQIAVACTHVRVMNSSPPPLKKRKKAVAYAGKVGEAATQTLLMQVLENTSNPTSQHHNVADVT